jgi:hypothetical protein
VPNDPSGNTRGNGSGRYIFGDDSPGADHTTISDGDASGNHHTRAEPNITADADVALALWLIPEWGASDELVIGSGEEHARSERNMIAEVDASGGISSPNETIFTDVALSSERNS